MLHVAQAVCGSFQPLYWDVFKGCTPLLGIKVSQTGSWPPCWGGGAPKLSLYRKISLDKPMLTKREVSGWHAVMLGGTKNPEARYPEARKKPVDFEERKGQRRSQQSPRARPGLRS